MEGAILLIAIAGAGIYYVSFPSNIDGSKTDSPSGRSATHMFDFSEGGSWYQTYKPQSLTSTSLNDAYAPYASPLTTPTHSIPEVQQAMADNGATVEAYAPKWFFQHWMEIPNTTAQQATHNIEIPGPDGFKGGSSLTKYPRVYMEHSKDKQFTNKNNMRAGMPTENEIKSVYPANKMPTDHNPYQGGGVFQKLAGRRYARNTLSTGADLSNKPNTRNF